MKKVLWVTSEFPPRINVATIRNIKFLKYLPQFGWGAIVICPSEYLKHSETSQRLLDQLSSAITITYKLPDPFHILENKRYLGYLVRNLIPPDTHTLWALAVLAQISREVERHKPDVVYTTCSPFSLNLIGAWIKQKYHIPWVTDFRDLWTLNPLIGHTTHYYRFISKYLEKFYLEHCDALIVTSDNSQKRMIAKYPRLANRTWTIFNGFDPDDIPLDSKNSPIPNSLLYSGTIYEKTSHTPLCMLQLLAYLVNNQFLDISSWELHYAGDKANLFADLVRQSSLPIKYKTHGYLNPHSYYQLIQQMSYVFICMPQELDTKSWLPARLYDYIGNKSRIICLSSRDSEVTGLLTRYGNGIMLYYDEPIEVQAQKLGTYLSNQSLLAESSEIFIKNFSRRELTSQLTQIFTKVTDVGRPSEESI